MSIKAYAALGPKQPLEPFEYEPGPLGPHEVEVKVSHCGICHSDLAMIDNDWGFTGYPLVPGHEVIGTIAAIGSDVEGVAIGQRVGVGWHCGSCGHCEWCSKGLESLCANERATIVHHHGGWAESVRVQAKFAVPIPDAIESKVAGPFMCAGSTVFTPMARFGVTPTMKTAVVGIGGLGHLAVQFLAAFGCEVTAISSSHSKDEEAKQMGATHFIATKGTDELKQAVGSFDFIISTVGADLPWDEYVAALRPQGRLVLVGVPDSALKLSAFPLLAEKSVSGGSCGGPSDTALMLDFAARSGVRPIVEVFPMDRINDAIDHLRAGKAPLSRGSRNLILAVDVRQADHLTTKRDPGLSRDRGIALGLSCFFGQSKRFSPDFPVLHTTIGYSFVVAKILAIESCSPDFHQRRLTMNRTHRSRRPGRNRPRVEGLEARSLLSLSGSIDASFGTLGYASLPSKPTTSTDYLAEAGAIAVQPDGKILVLGYGAPDSSRVDLVRLNANGTVDTTFGTDGFVAIPGESNSTASALLIEANGQILVGGTQEVLVNSYDEVAAPFVARVNANGSLDTSFGTSGTGVVTLGTDGTEPDNLTSLASILQESNGTILLAGGAAPDNVYGFGVIGLNSDGSIDTAFGTDGQAVVHVSTPDFNSDTVFGAALQPNGQIVVVGSELYGEFPDGVESTRATTYAVAIRLNADGSPDTTFGGTAASSLSAPGTVVLAPLGTSQGGASFPSTEATSVAIEPSGQIILAGPDTGRLSVDVLDSNGVPDTSFGNNSGRELLNGIAGGNADVQLGPGGLPDVLVDGPSDEPSGPQLLVQLTGTGSLSPTFGDPTNPGEVSISNSGLAYYGTALAIQPNGEIVTAGTVTLTPSSQTQATDDVTVARFLATPTPALDQPPADFQGNGISDLAVYLPASGSFAYRPSDGEPDVIEQFGIPGVGQTIPAPGDYSGAGQTELGAYFPSQGVYAYRPADGGPDVLEAFGIPGPGQSIPTPGDYFGTGVDDIAVYMPSIGAFGIRNPNGGPDLIEQFGIAGAGQSIPAPGDYFGTGQTDLAVYLPSLGAFAIRNPAGGPDEIIPFGIPGAGNSIPIPGDYDGSGKTELAVYFPKLGEFAYRPANGGPDVIEQFGAVNDGSIPVPGDYTGVGYDEIGIFDPNYADFAYRPANGGADVIEQFGSPGIGGSLPLAAPIASNVTLANPTTVSAEAVTPIQNSSVVPTGPMMKLAARSQGRIASTPPAQADLSKQKT